MHKLSQRLALIITNSSRIDDTTEMVSYSLEAILTTGITALTSLLFSIFFNCLYEFIIFNLCFIPIRMRHKSFHFKKFIQCFLTSNLMIIVCFLILKYIQYYFIFTPLFFLSLLSLYLLSIERNKSETFIVAIIFTLSLFFNQVLSLSLLLSVLVNTFLMIGRIYNEKNIKHV